MPGHDLDRVIDVPTQLLNELTCVLCKGIFNDPVMAQCCRQCFCRDCITRWIGRQNVCPTDGTQLTEHQLRPVSQELKRIIDNLKIKCNFDSVGCDAQLTIDELARHLEECKCNPNAFCRTCKMKRDSDHNCVNSLLAEINNSELRAYDQTEQVHMIDVARNNIENCVVIKRINIDQELFEFIVNNAKKVIQNENNFLDMNRKLFAELERSQKDGWVVDRQLNWNVVVGNNIAMTAHHINYLHLRFGPIDVCVFSSHKEIQKSKVPINNFQLMHEMFKPRAYLAGRSNLNN